MLHVCTTSEWCKAESIPQSNKGFFFKSLVLLSSISSFIYSTYFRQVGLIFPIMLKIWEQQSFVIGPGVSSTHIHISGCAT